jgi:RNA polymerase sigma-70 factor (ECF subfamily)
MGGETQRTFQALIEQHKKILYKVCHAYCRDMQDREDLAQDIVAQLWRSYPGFDGRATFSTWMYRVALNVAISAHRADTMRHRHVVSDEERLLCAVDPAATDPSDLRMIHQVMASLDAMNRSLMLLYLDGYAAADIAHMLGISETNVTTRISRVKQQIQQTFST